VLTHQICICINTEYYPKLAELKKAPSARSSFRLIARANPDAVNRESARGGEARRMTRTVTTTLVTLCSVITILQAPRAWLLVSRPTVTSRGRVGLASHSTFSTQLRHDFHDAPAPARRSLPSSCLGRARGSGSPLRPSPYILNHARPVESIRSDPRVLQSPSCSCPPRAIELYSCTLAYAETQTLRHTQVMMLLMDSGSRGDCSPVCLDLSVGLSPPSPGSGPETTADAERLDRPATGCWGPRTSSLADGKDEVTDRRPFPRRSVSTIYRRRRRP
jgi:hypothetical protein